VIDVGCGIGRWSRLLARNGAEVTGVDLSPTMIGEAQRRTKQAGLDCRFIISDLVTLELPEKFDFICGVTVLQHILDDGDLARALQNLVRHLAPGGRMVLLEAAPTTHTSRCDTAVFRARTSATYQKLFREAALHCVEVTGVDPAPFKTRYLPVHRALPRWLAGLALFAVTLVSLPVDLLVGRRLCRASWHKVFVLEHR
jgi:SAM-dependent methyltransferase